MKGKKFIPYIIAIIVVIMLFIGTISNFIINIEWYKSIGYISVYLTRIIATLTLMVPIFIISIVAMITYYKSIRKNLMKEIGSENLKIKSKSFEKRTVYSIAAIVSFLISLSISIKYWYIILQFTNSQNFGIKDQIFNNDVSFYIFKLPLIKIILSGLFLVLISLLIITFISYVVLISRDNISNIAFDRNKMNIRYMKGNLTKFAGRQLAVVSALMFIILSGHYMIKCYELVYSPRGVVFGASYTDTIITLNFYRGIAVVSILSAIVVFFSINKNRVKPIAISIIIIVILVLGENVASLLVQRFVVKANEFDLEKKYIKYNIDFTRKGFNLENINESSFDVVNNLNKQDISNNEEIISNIKLNAFNPTLQFYNQVQPIRYYYNFNDIDVDRYNINNKYTQVFIAPREINVDAIEPNTWVNKHLKYTHGYGIVMNKVNSVTSEGQPDFVIKDIPPDNLTNLDISNPRIYFGENTKYYSIVNTDTEEFDAPKGGENQTNKYDGKDGIKLNIINRLLFAINKKDINIILSKDINSNSKMLINREILDRVNKITPFIKYDKDPYVVVNNGRLYWVLDGYTTTDKYPFAEPYNGINYIRNSVKAIVDAYDGTTNFYIWDESDPIIKCYDKIFKGLFKNKNEMPKEFNEHIRYPQDMFKLQTKVLGKYHMTDPSIFFNGEDLWDVAKAYNSTEQDDINKEAAYMMTKLPGENKAEMVLMEYFNMRNKENMLGILAARMDGDNYGKMQLYKFPPKKTIYSPWLFNSKINGDSNISKEISLWKSKDSTVEFGDTMIIPINKSLLYVQPLYIRSNSKNSIPEMKRVIVYMGDKVVIEDNIDKALNTLLSGEAITSDIGNNKKEAEIKNNHNETLFKVKELYNKALEAQKNGEWSKYGEYIKELGSLLEKETSN